jgi:hypothetical protein
MSTDREGLQAILRKHQPQLDQALQALQGDLRAHVDSFSRMGLDEDVYEINALGIYNEAFDLREQVASFFATWVDE